jgi:hypothetical protein
MGRRRSDKLFRCFPGYASSDNYSLSNISCTSTFINRLILAASATAGFIKPSHVNFTFSTAIFGCFVCL